MEKKLVAFCCENSASKAAGAVSDAGVLDAVDLVRLPCSGKIEIGLILKVLEEGHPGALVLGCPVDDCKYLVGSTRARKRVEATRKLLKEAGVDERRVAMDFVSSVDGHKIARIVREMQGRLLAPRAAAAATAAATGKATAVASAKGGAA